MFYVVAVIIWLVIFKFYHSIFDVAYFSCQSFCMELLVIGAIASIISGVICELIGVSIPF